MKKIWLVMGIVFFVGCVKVRTYETEKPRIDTTIEGNQGFLSGTPKVEPKATKLGPNRKTSVLEIELGSAGKASAKKSSSQEAVLEEDTASVQEAETSSQTQGSEAKNYTLYTVAKDDTLQKIAHKFYGTTKKWKLIYNNNTDVIKNPDRLYPGTEIKVPVLE